MARSRSGSIFLSALLALGVLTLFAYLLFTDSPTSRTQQAFEPPIEIMEPELPHEIITVEDDGLPDREALNEADAEAFIEQLAGEETNEIIILQEHQNQFVRPDSIIALPNLEERVTTLQRLSMDETLAPDTPITLTYTEEKQETVTLKKLAETTEDLIAPVTIVTETGEEITAPLVELLERETLDHDTPVTYVTRQTRTRETTAKELDSLDIPPSQTVQATITRSVELIPLAEILDETTIEAGSLLYLHRVTEADRKGLWGILLNGLIERFRTGLSIDGLRNREIVSVTIPDDADQILPSGFSSFLGRILYHKVQTSYVYNFKTQTMGNNPDLIFPGQQLIMIQFSPDELREIYLYFIADRDEVVEVYSIGR